MRIEGQSVVSINYDRVLWGSNSTTKTEAKTENVVARIFRRIGELFSKLVSFLGLSEKSADSRGVAGGGFQRFGEVEAPKPLTDFEQNVLNLERKVNSLETKLANINAELKQAKFNGKSGAVSTFGIFQILDSKKKENWHPEIMSALNHNRHLDRLNEKRSMVLADLDIARKGLPIFEPFVEF